METEITLKEALELIERQKLEIEYLKLQIQDLINAVASSSFTKTFGN